MTYTQAAADVWQAEDERIAGDNSPRGCIRRALNDMHHCLTQPLTQEAWDYLDRAGEGLLGAAYAQPDEELEWAAERVDWIVRTAWHGPSMSHWPLPGTHARLQAAVSAMRTAVGGAQ